MWKLLALPGWFGGRLSGLALLPSGSDREEPLPWSERDDCEECEECEEWE